MQKSEVVIVRLTPDERGRLDTLSARTGRTKSELIRHSLETYERVLNVQNVATSKGQETSRTQAQA